MTVKLRKPIACTRVLWCEKHQSDHPPADDSIRAVCGVCRSDVWISPDASARFTQEPDDHILACMECAIKIWQDMIRKMPDISLRIGEERYDFEVKSQNGAEDDFPPWAFSGSNLRPIEIAIAIDLPDDDEPDDEET
jgi:hypothetical protein